jgi:hypothetical protein
MMCGGESRQPLTLHPCGHGGIAGCARLGLHIAHGNIDGQCFMRHAQIGADARHMGRLIRRFHAQSVIHGRRRHAPGQSRMGQSQQGQTVRPARNGKGKAGAFPPALGPDPRQIRAKARDQRGIDQLHAAALRVSSY